MDKQTFIDTIDGHIRSFKEKVAQNDGSGVAAIAASAKDSLLAMKQSVMDSEKGKKALDAVHDYLHKLEDAAKKGDKKLTAKVLGLMENAMKEWSDKDDKDSHDSSCKDENGKDNAENDKK